MLANLRTKQPKADKEEREGNRLKCPTQSYLSKKTQTLFLYNDAKMH